MRIFLKSLAVVFIVYLIGAYITLDFLWIWSSMTGRVLWVILILWTSSFTSYIETPKTEDFKTTTSPYLMSNYRKEK